MPNRLVIFPHGKETSANAYRVWGDEKNGDAAVALGLSREDNSVFSAPGRVDKDGQMVVNYFGPPYTIDGVHVIEEPADGPAMRADGVLSDIWSPPEDI